jgi:hypothetical protein
MALDVQRELCQQLVRQVDHSFAAVLRRSDLDLAAARALHLSPDAEAAVQEVDVAELDGSGLAEPQASEGGQGEQGGEAAVGRVEDGADLPGEATVIQCSGLPTRGRARPWLGSRAMTRSRTAPRRTARTLLVRVRMVPGLRPASVMILTNCSRWERRSRFIGTSPKVTVRADRSIAFSVVDSQTWRLAHSR